MSLIDSMMEDFKIMNKAKVSDGEGGSTVTWSEGASIKCALTLDSSLRAKIAESEGFTNVYTVTTSKTTNIEFGDVIKRVRDSKIFRITSDPTDNISPSASTLNMKQATAEKWRLTT